MKMCKNMESTTIFPHNVCRKLQVMLSFAFLLYLMAITPSSGHIAGKGELRPPFSRQVRGPTIPSSEEEYNKGLVYLKSPAYMSRFRPQQKLSQFHSYQTYPILSGLTPNSGLNIFNIPGMSTSTQQKNRVEDFDSSIEHEPTFTPFISARALSNMERFFDHLKENLKALHKDQGDQSTSSSGDENGEDDDGNFKDFDWDSIHSDGNARALAAVLRPQSPQNFIGNNGQMWLPPASGIIRNRVNRNKDEMDDDESGDIKRTIGFHPSLSRIGLGRK